MSKSPRIYVTLCAETEQLVKELADANAISVSQLLRTMLEGMTDQLRDAAAIARAARTLTEAQTAALQGQLDLGEAELLKSASEASKALSDALVTAKKTDVGGEARTHLPTGRVRARRPAKPPVFNKGAKKEGDGGQK